MEPLQDSLPKLSEDYKKTKKREIENFFTNNFANDFENMSFLVAKNGQIIYEKYDDNFRNLGFKNSKIVLKINVPVFIVSYPHL
jgi:hypothetical protein